MEEVSGLAELAVPQRCGINQKLERGVQVSLPRPWVYLLAASLCVVGCCAHSAAHLAAHLVAHLAAHLAAQQLNWRRLPVVHLRSYRGPQVVRCVEN